MQCDADLNIHLFGNMYNFCSFFQLLRSPCGAVMHILDIVGLISGEARGFKVGGGGLRGGGVHPPAGGPGAVPPEKFSNYRCTQVSFSAFFRQKSTH
jgi:hypothetical protein